MGKNLPPGAEHDPRAPYNRPEPGEKRVLGTVHVAADAVVSEQDSEKVHRAILMEQVRKHLPHDMQVLAAEIEETEPL